jgi:hypothetical protein
LKSKRNFASGSIAQISPAGAKNFRVSASKPTDTMQQEENKEPQIPGGKLE